MGGEVHVVKWEQVAQDFPAQEWESNLSKLEGFSIYQSHAWGEHKKFQGQEVGRFIARAPDGRILLMLQGMVRRAPLGAAILWCPGGVAGDLEFLEADFDTKIKKLLGAKILAIRMSMHRKKTPYGISLMHASGARRAKEWISGPLSMSFYPSRTQEEIQEGMTSNWRHNLKRYKPKEMRIEEWKDPNAVELFSLYKEMEGIKGIAEQYNLRELEGILTFMRPHLRIYRCVGTNGDLIGIRACTTLGNQGWDFLAALSDLGRRKYVAYALTWEVLMYCHQKGVQHYNFMGIDPENNPGVYNFKKGTGAEILEYLGEWDWGSGVLCLAFNLLLKFQKVKS